MAYITAAQLILRYDVRVLGDLSVDDGTRPNAAAVEASDRVEACIDDAAAEIDASIRIGQRYTADEIATLIADGDDLLKRLNADLALGMLYQVRGVGVPDNHAKAIENARNFLVRLKSGEAVLNVDAARNAGVPSSASTPDADRLTMDTVGNSPLFPPLQTRTTP